VVRDSNGRAQFANPSASADAATKAYVDDLAVEVINEIFSVGSWYIQFPGGETPATKGLPGTWEEQFGDEGIAFRTPGGYALPFNGGIQEDSMLRLLGTVSFPNRGGVLDTTTGVFNTDDSRTIQRPSSGDSGNFRDSLNFDPIGYTDKVNDYENRMRNRTFRVWERMPDPV